MNNFCTKCGSRLVDGQPCQYCGGTVQQQPQQFNQPVVNQSNESFNMNNVGVNQPSNQINENFNMSNVGVNQPNPNFNMGTMNPQQPMVNTGEKFKNKKAVSGLVLGVVAFFIFGFLAFFGLPMSIAGLTEAKEHNGEGKGIAVAGIVICAIDCVLILLNVIMTAAGLV